MWGKAVWPDRFSNMFVCERDWVTHKVTPYFTEGNVLIPFMKGRLFRWSDYDLIHVVLCNLPRRVRNVLESHLFRSAKNFAIRRPIFKLRYPSNQLRYKKGTYIFWKFRNLSFIWLWFHAIISICVWSAQFWKKVSQNMGFCRLQKLPIFSTFCHFEKMLDFERL